MVKSGKVKTESSSEAAYKIFLTAVTVICTAATIAVLSFKTFTLQSDISALRQELILQADANREMHDSIRQDLLFQAGRHKETEESVKKDMAINRKAIKTVETSFYDWKSEINNLFKAVTGSLKTIEDKTDAIQRATTNVWQIERSPTPHDIIVKRREGHTPKTYGGVGLELRKGADSLIVVGVFDGMPAQKAGLYAGDEILEIDGQPTSEMSAQEFPGKLRGPAGSPVNLSYRPAGSVSTVKQVTVTRAMIDLSKVDKVDKEK